MFEILQALIALQTACRAHDTDLAWNVTWEAGSDHPTLRAEIHITEDDSTFVEDMRALVAE